VLAGSGSTSSNVIRSKHPRMVLIRIFFNACIMAGEIAAVVAVSWLGYSHPYLFAAVTAGLSFLLGVRLEIARLRNELSFYFGRPMTRGGIFVALVAGAESIVKGLVAGLVALLTFAGTNADRLFWVAVVFGACLYVGSAVLRRLTISFAAIPARWGFFRLAPPLGLLFSLGMTLALGIKLVAHPQLSDIAQHLFVNMPAHPGIEQVSELLYLVKQYVDDFIVGLATGVFGDRVGFVLGGLFSSNTLTGFIIAVYAVVIAEAVVWLEDRLL
jgi:hypothetical protein